MSISIQSLSNILSFKINAYNVSIVYLVVFTAICLFISYSIVFFVSNPYDYITNFLRANIIY